LYSKPKAKPKAELKAEPEAELKAEPKAELKAELKAENGLICCSTFAQTTHSNLSREYQILYHCQDSDLFKTTDQIICTRHFTCGRIGKS